MNSWQMFQQIKYLLLAATWGGTGTRVFPTGGVIVSADQNEDFLGRVRMPCILIRVGTNASDPEFGEEPDLIVQNFDVALATSVSGDPFGQNAFLGANRSQGASPGKGLLELEEILFSTIKSLGASSGIRVAERGKSAAAGVPHPTLGYIAWRNYSFEATVSAARSYQAPSKFVATGGSGQCVMSWTNAPLRFDSRGGTGKVILRRAAGSTAPATPTSGTGVTLSSDTATSKTDSGLSAGTYSYSLFAIYDEYGTNSDAQWSNAVSKTVAVT